ncbi:MAG: type II toxin-antitoxin system RelE/ParE family toxin [Caldilineaceae bacterium]|nr:type II toxin-antitoxin system RelE/ParE family toxin [Caldilineaceae bacterium]
MPPNYTINLTSQARRDLDRLPQHIRAWAVETIDNLAIEPRPSGCKRLQGGLGYSIRRGHTRLVYDVTDRMLLIVVVRVAHRRDFYR